MADIVASDDNDGPDVFPTLDEAIAHAFADCEDGEEVAIHEATCQSGEWADEESDEYKPCNCSPEVHVVRRGRA